MTSQRLNSVVVLNVQRDLTDELDIPAVADEFVRGNSVRTDIFGWLDVLTWLCVTQITAVDICMIVAYIRFIISFFECFTFHTHNKKYWRSKHAELLLLLLFTLHAECSQFLKLLHPKCSIDDSPIELLGCKQWEIENIHLARKCKNLFRIA